MNRVGSLFSGCLGLDRGLERAGWKLAWACENDAACRRVIERRRPGVPVLTDVRDVDAGTPRVDLIAGGFPCQDLSHAGLGAGLGGERSGLWFDMARTIRLLRPRLVLIENVPGLATRMGARADESALGTVIRELAESLYVGTAFRLRASDLGAPHQRERIFILAADAGRERLDGGRGANQGGEARGGPDGWAGAAGPRVPAADAHGAGRGEHGRAEPVRAEQPAAERPGEAAADAHGGRWLKLGQPEPAGLEGACGREPDGCDTVRQLEYASAWGPYAAAIERWERALGRAAPAPTDGRGRLMPEFSEWMLGFPAGWTEGERRTERLRMLGNAVQVQCGELVGHVLRAVAV